MQNVAIFHALLKMHVAQFKFKILQTFTLHAQFEEIYMQIDGVTELSFPNLMGK